MGVDVNKGNLVTVCKFIMEVEGFVLQTILCLRPYAADGYFLRFAKIRGRQGDEDSNRVSFEWGNEELIKRKEVEGDSLEEKPGKVPVCMVSEKGETAVVWLIMYACVRMVNRKNDWPIMLFNNRFRN